MTAHLEFSFRAKGQDTPVQLGGGHFPHSPGVNLAYLCVDCGRGWGYVRTQNARTWRVYYRSCGCLLHDAMSLFEPGMFQLTPYGRPHLDCMKWETDFQFWPDELIKHEFTQLLANFDKSVFYDSPRRDNE